MSSYQHSSFPSPPIASVATAHGGSSSSHHSSNGDNGPRAKCDQVIFEAFAKATELIVASRGSVQASPPPTSVSSSRFNLQVPENPQVRSILQRWKRALHVPLRLDVYYEHDEQKRELLERWCLEYRVGNQKSANQPTEMADPIAQLRNVCKRIVVWLRTLYCQTRLLPAFQAYNQVGFSLYAVDNAQDEREIMPNFVKQTHSSVLAPYGVLTLQCWYAKNIPTQAMQTVRRSTQKNVLPPGTTKSRPIPIPTQMMMDQTHTLNDVAQSAPAQVGQYNQHHHLRTQSLQRNEASMPQSMRTAQTSLQRRHTDLETIDDLKSTTTQTNDDDDNNYNNSDNRPPERVLSGLTLALMSEHEANTTAETDAEHSIRRAALHHTPPHLKKSGEYGYAYNNHIAWQSIKPSQNPPTRGADLISMNSMSSSPVLAGTPPSGVFLGQTPPLSSLIPPYRGGASASSSMLTPPFAARPLGFADHAPPPLDIPPPALDALPSSPFQQAAASTYSTGNAKSTTMSILLAGSADMKRSLWGHHREEDLLEEMPFAVDESGGSTVMAASSTVFKSAGRLKLFEQSSRDVDDLASQLAEFKSFGQSLSQSDLSMPTTY